jgi:hypothetical protein
MSTFTYAITLLVTIVFIIAPLWLAISVIYRYNRVERAVVYYTAMLRAVMGHLEGRQRTVPPLPAPEPLPEAVEDQPTLATKVRSFFRSRIVPEAWLSDLKLRDEFEDYLAIVRHGPSERERYMRLKRKNLTMQQGVTEDVEFCRTYTEMLPYMGILGTVLGFFFSPAIFMPDATISVTIGGLVVALTSTAAALLCILIIKLGYENRVIPKAIEFEQTIYVIDDYARRFGDLELAREREADLQ